MLLIKDLAFISTYSDVGELMDKFNYNSEMKLVDCIAEIVK